MFAFNIIYMRYLIIILLQFLYLFGICQTSEETQPKFAISIGAQTRITPIYLKRLPDLIIVSDRNTFEQPDQYLSGPSLVYKIERSLNEKFSVSFSHAIKYHFLYLTFTFNNQRIQGFHQETKRAVISDFYLDGGYMISPKFKLSLGVALCGIGSDYLLTQRFPDNNNQSIYVTSKENFIFPAITSSIGWKKNNFLVQLRMGYCWNNPTEFKTPFLFLELGIQYQLFSF